MWAKRLLTFVGLGLSLATMTACNETKAEVDDGHQYIERKIIDMGIIGENPSKPAVIIKKKDGTLRSVPVEGVQYEYSYHYSEASQTMCLRMKKEERGARTGYKPESIKFCD